MAFADACMKVLIACEFSGVVRDAFAARGHDAWSCDQLPTEKPGNHFQCDIVEVLYGGWDMLIAHPPCTYLANSGNKHLYLDEGREEKAQSAAEFFKVLLNAPILSKCIENPIMRHAVQRVGRKQDQVIEPHQFWHLDVYGKGEKKATCLWLENLPLLKPTTPDEPGRIQACWRMPPSPNRARERSRTYRGIADAMAEQWGNL